MNSRSAWVKVTGRKNVGALTLLVSLTVGLSACGFLSGGSPRVLSVTPSSGATGVATNATVQAELELAGGQLNVTTLTDTSVYVTSGGQAVPANRELSEDGSTLIVTPNAALAPNTTYEFSVTDAVKLADDTSLQPFSSTFSTGGGGSGSAGGLVASPSPVVFTAGGVSSSDTRTVTLTNTGATALELTGLELGGAAAPQYTVTGGTGSLEAGASRDVTLGFTAGEPGPALATLTVTTSAASLEIPLGGLSVAGQGGNLEPSLQWILDAYALPIETGDDDPSTTGLVDDASNSLLGDEITAPLFKKLAGAPSVTAEVLAVFGVENDPVLEFGYYAAATADSRQQLFEIQQTPALNAQRLGPVVGGAVDGDGVVSFDPGGAAFGFYSFWPSNRFFEQRYVYTEDALNTFADAIPHQVRVYPLKNADGSLEPNAYVLATEEFTQGFDYNDVVVIVRNVTVEASGLPTPGGTTPQPVPATPPSSGIAGLSVRNPLGEPFGDRLVLQKILRPTGNFCDPAESPGCDPSIDRWDGISFPNTGVVALENTGASPLALNVTTAYSGLFAVTGGPTSFTVQPGETYELTVEFIATGAADKGVFPDALLVTSGAQQAGLELAGVFLERPEGSGEVFLEGLINDAFGYQTVLGADRRGGIASPEPDSPLAGEEVRAAYWQAANPGAPVVALQLAAFYPCCTSGFSLQFYNRGDPETSFATLRADNLWGQSIYPHAQGQDGPGRLEVNASGAFELRSANYSSDPSLGSGRGKLGMRFWPLRDRGGNLVANSYIVAQDFVRGGCGGASSSSLRQDQVTVSNCDYNDTVFLISNIAPVQ